jgi:hypothetical protein
MDYLAHLRQELAALGDCLGGDLSAPVEHCGDWTLYDLASHLGGGNLWAAAAVTEQRGDYEAAPAPRDPEAVGGRGARARHRGPARCSAGPWSPDPKLAQARTIGSLSWNIALWAGRVCGCPCSPWAR